MAASLDAGSQHVSYPVGTITTSHIPGRDARPLNGAGKPELVGLVELTVMADVPRKTVDKWRERGILPTVDYEVSGTPIWFKTRMVAWLHETGRL